METGAIAFSYAFYHVIIQMKPLQPPDIAVGPGGGWGVGGGDCMLLALKVSTFSRDTPFVHRLQPLRPLFVSFLTNYYQIPNQISIF